MRLPNGYGSVTKMSGKRRNPYVVRKTIGYHYDAEKDRQVQDIVVIGYARTKNEGLRMLAEYNQAPYDLDLAKMTFKQVYDAWSKRKYPKISKTNKDGYSACYKVCTELYDIPMRNIRLADLQRTVDTSGKNYPTLQKLKVLFSQLYNYAMEHDICEKNYSQYVDILQYKDKRPVRYIRERFSRDEVSVIWEHQDDPYYQTILMLIYSGVRINELLALKKSDVNIDEQYFSIPKSKTEAGVRDVPIADKVLPFFKSWLVKYADSEYLISTPAGSKFGYKNYYRNYYTNRLEVLGVDHTPHCCRHTFVSELTEAKIDPRVIKTIVGHSGGFSTTEKVYMHISMQTFLDAVNLIP